MTANNDHHDNKIFSMIQLIDEANKIEEIQAKIHTWKVTFFAFQSFKIHNVFLGICWNDHAFKNLLLFFFDWNTTSVRFIIYVEELLGLCLVLEGSFPLSNALKFEIEMPEIRFFLEMMIRCSFPPFSSQYSIE